MDIYQKLSEIIYDKKASLTPEEIFTSEIFKEYMEKKARNIVSGSTTILRKKGFDIPASLENTLIAGLNVTVVHKPDEKELTAYCASDARGLSHNICINTANELVTMADTKAEQMYKILGFLYHEIGHLLYTSYPVLCEWREKAGKGNWYPRVPSGIKTENGKIVQKYFEKKDCRKVIFSILDNLENSIEDAYIEAEMMEQCPGRGKKSIDAINESLVESMPTLEESIKEQPEAPLFALFNQILLYAKFDTTKTGQYKGELLKALDGIKEIVNDNRYKRSQKERINAVNDIIIALAPYFEETLKNILKKQKEQQKQMENLANLLKNGKSSGTKSDSSSSEGEEGEESEEENGDENGNNSKKKSSTKKGSSDKDSDKENADGTENGDSSENSDDKSGENKSAKKGKGTDKDNSTDGETSSSAEGEEMSEGDNLDGAENGKSGSSSDEESEDEGEENQESGDGTDTDENDGEFSIDDFTEEEIGEALNEILEAIEEIAERQDSSKNESCSSDSIINPNSEDEKVKEDNKEAKNKTETGTKSDKGGNGDGAFSAIENELNDLINKMSQNQAKHDVEELRAKDMNDQYGKISAEEFGLNEYENVSIHRAPDVTEANIRQYEKYGKIIEDLGYETAQGVKRILKIRASGDNRNNCLSGVRLQNRNLYNYKVGKGMFNVKAFNRKMKLAIGILVDQSGSTSGTLIKSAMLASMVMEAFCRELDIPLIISGYNGGCQANIASYVEPDSIDDNDKYRLTGMNASGGTPTKGAMVYMLNRLEELQADRKMMFVISDGSSADNRYCLRNGVYAPAIPVLIENAKAKDTTVIGVGIGSDRERVKYEFSGSDFIDISDVNNLPEQIIDAVENEILGV